MADYTLELCPESGSFLGSKTPSTEYANDFSKVSNTVKFWNVTHEVLPSPTAGTAKNKFKITVQDGPVPPRSGVDGSGHQDQNVYGAPGVQHGAGAGTGAGEPIHSAVAYGDGQGVVDGNNKSGGDKEGSDPGGMGWVAQQKEVVHDPTPSTTIGTASLPAAQVSATAIRAGAGAAGESPKFDKPNNGVVEEIIEGPNPHIAAPSGGGLTNYLAEPIVSERKGKGKCPAKNGSQAKRSEQVDVRAETTTRKEGPRGSAQRHRATVSPTP
jgi:hypothetical protein